MNPQEVKDLWHNLAIDGIADIKDCYPRHICKDLEDNGYMEEDNNYDWRFSEEGRNKFPTPKSLYDYIMGDEEEERHKDSLGYDSEEPYMRGHETDGG